MQFWTRFHILFKANFCLGIILGVGQSWTEQRRFAIRNLRDFGFGKKDMEGLIMDEVKEILEWIKNRNGEPIHELHRRFSLASVNALWTILSGERYDHDDVRLTRILDQLET